MAHRRSIVINKQTYNESNFRGINDIYEEYPDAFIMRTYMVNKLPHAKSVYESYLLLRHNFIYIFVVTTTNIYIKTNLTIDPENTQDFIVFNFYSKKARDDFAEIITAETARYIMGNPPSYNEHEHEQLEMFEPSAPPKDI